MMVVYICVINGKVGRMPKTINTPRDELVCGKIEALTEILTDAKVTDAKLIDALYLLRDIQHDCNRMEQGLIRRKEQVQELIKKG